MNDQDRLQELKDAASYTEHKIAELYEDLEKINESIRKIDLTECDTRARKIITCKPYDYHMRTGESHIMKIENRAYPGIFLCGQDALKYAAYIEMLLKNRAEFNDHQWALGEILSLIKLLKTCEV